MARKLAERQGVTLYLLHGGVIDSRLYRQGVRRRMVGSDGCGRFAGFFTGVFKEVWDDIESQGSEESDWAADIVGTTLGAIIVTILTL